MMLGTHAYAIREARFLAVPQEFLLSPNGRNSSSAALPAVKSVPLVRLHRRRRRSGQEIGERSPARVVVVSCASPATAAPAATGKGAGKSTVTATISVQTEVESLLANIGIGRGLDDIADLLGKSIQVELVSSELNLENGKEKESIKGWAHKGKKGDGVQKYEAKLEVESGFGEVGAVLITNVHHTEMYFKEIELRGLPEGDVHITCNSWVHPQKDSPQKRVFFTDKSFLPSATPEGLKKLRTQELETLRGNGEGERKTHERIYDYDVYNDLGNPDSSDSLKRPVLGGKEHPYPRRCRTGRSKSKKDPQSETRVGALQTPYVPRDEAFSGVKGVTFSAKTLKSVLHTLVPNLLSVLKDDTVGFPFFTAIDTLFQDGLRMKKPGSSTSLLNAVVPRLVKLMEGQELLLFEMPEMIERDKFSWFRDEEFARQTLAGLNPLSIQLLTEFPIVSKLDPKVYGPPESAITKQLVEQQIRGVMTVEEAIEQKKLFIVDYHDILLPYVNKVRELSGTTLYGSRALFFHNKLGTLEPVAIELTRPPSSTKPQWKQVFSPGVDATNVWLWRLAKAHFLAHDSGYHQLVSHWLRTHCCTEPYIIAANRQLSAMHPIYRLLHPHFRYTMEINALARQDLINADGIIEKCFSPLKYSIEISSAAYDKLWRFDYQALPADLIQRGMAVEDPTAEHGVRLVIDDYPFANDGLLIWSATKEWVADYVNHFYEDSQKVVSDAELQAWWSEVRNKGHADKKDEPWWPALDSRESLVQVLTTIIWVVSGHHAAVNFGQYPYGGYFPNRPTIARTNIPTEDDSAMHFDLFLKKPESALLGCFPSQTQATLVMAILDVLSTHSIDEEYLGQQAEPVWQSDPAIMAVFEKFNGKLKQIERIIDERNTNRELRNRSGAGILPYELLKPFSQPGVTGKGIPTSISI
ncbi:linoleate 13S-lipoxygenase 2-1, chloroplastic-like [Nymphaea colorata]|nr:linoleate 13S-lipoxygenase 2-1, chloroplastic-like [Nymphaea colorata]